MAERLDIEDFLREIDHDLCQYAYTFCESGFTSNTTMRYWQEQEMLAPNRGMFRHHNFIA